MKDLKTKINNEIKKAKERKRQKKEKKKEKKKKKKLNKLNKKIKDIYKKEIYGITKDNNIENDEEKNKTAKNNIIKKDKEKNDTTNNYDIEKDSKLFLYASITTMLGYIGKYGIYYFLINLFQKKNNSKDN